jgi:alpha-1,6-mannosyltransferase
VALGAAAATFAGVTLAAGLGLGWVNALRHTGELVQWSSVPTAVGMAIGYLTGPQAIPIARALGLAALAGIGVALLRMAWRGRPVAACAWMLAATALLGPVFYPWYALAPLALLAAVRVPPKWLLTAALLCTFLTLPNGQGIPALTKAPGAYAVTAVLIALAIRTIRRRRPEPAA